MKNAFVVTLLTILVTTFPHFSIAQNNTQDQHLTFKIDTRLDGTYTALSGKEVKNTSGFTGRYFNLILNGNITNKFSYSVRHRLYTAPGNPQEFFSNTDWVNLTYQFDPRFSVTAGKQVVLIGGYEYDYAPIDVFFWSDFWNNVNPYQIGFNVGYTSLSQNHTLKLQLVNSPFSKKGMESCYAYNLIWYGKMDFFSTIWSVNLVEYQRGHFINYVSLGNRFDFGPLALEVDYMNRASGEQKNLFADFSVIGKLNWYVNPKLTLFAKGGYDQNKAQDPEATFVYDRYVLPGVRYGYGGVGAEYFPLKNKNIRIHACWYTNNSPANPQTFNIGVRWQMNIINR